MKRVSLLSLTFITIALVSSCAKNHTCTCSYNIGGISQPAEVVSAKSNTTDAKAWCAGTQSYLNSQPGASGITCTVN